MVPKRPELSQDCPYGTLALLCTKEGSLEGSFTIAGIAIDTCDSLATIMSGCRRISVLECLKLARDVFHAVAKKRGVRGER